MLGPRLQPRQFAPHRGDEARIAAHVADDLPPRLAEVEPVVPLPRAGALGVQAALPRQGGQLLHVQAQAGQGGIGCR